MKYPLISIILPTYNVANHIERCITSCLSQSFDSFEIIIVDDCGTDKSIEIANTYASKDSRIKIIQHGKNLGTYHARKTGTFYAKGSFIFYLDPDDELADNALSVIAETISKYPELDLLLFNIKFVPALKLWNLKPSTPIGIFKERIPDKILRGRKLFYGTPGKVYSAKAALKAFDYLSIPKSLRLVFGEDILIFAGVLLNISCAVGISNKLYLYHRNQTSITKIKNKNTIENNLKQLEMVLNYLEALKNKRISNEGIQYFINRIKLSRLSLQKELVKSNVVYLKILIESFSISKSPRDLTRIIIFIITLANVKL